MSTLFQDYATIERSSLFDVEYYTQHNPDVAAANIDPITHYLEVGARERRNPSSAFDTSYYLEKCLKIGLNPSNPLLHYINEGLRLGLHHSAVNAQEHLKFGKANPPNHSLVVDRQDEFHRNREHGTKRPRNLMLSELEANLSSPFVNDALVHASLGACMHSPDAVEIYLRLPISARPNISHYFDRDYYLQKYPDAAQPGLDPLLHFISRGCSEGRSPHPLVDLDYIRSQDRSLLSEPTKPEELCDVLEYNLADPSCYFSVDYYRGQVKGVNDLPIALLEHFLTQGYRLGLRPNPFFDALWYLRQLEHVFDVRDAIRHFVLQGDREGRAPSPQFSSRRYLERYLDVADAAVPALAHYLSCGQYEGRSVLPENFTPAIQPPAVATDLGVREAPVLLGSNDSGYEAMCERIRAVRQKQKDCVNAKAPDILKLKNPITTCAKLKFKKVRDPKVSILVPVYDELSFTAECINSIERFKGKHRIEVVIADDASPDPAINSIRKIEGLVYVRQPSNVGFLRNCNSALKFCHGEYLLLLNNDAQLMPGALDALIAVLDADPEVAAVGPKILYPNGRLQEAGCAIDRNGNTTMVGLFADPSLPGFSFARDVHYCSGAALLIRSVELGDTLFDPEFAPAYCEDADLCLRLIANGRRIRYCPEAVVVHHLSVSTNKQSVTKRLQLVARNQQKLQQKWTTLLENMNKARVICFYLPQFHPTPENDYNWGKGFTEWTNVTRARPGYLNHYQPHLPADLGFYDLRVKQTIERQVALARRYGMSGFCVYYYNFGDQRALDQVLEAVAADPSLEFPFFICWANENWTRHWDGGAKHIIFEQKYDPDTLMQIIKDAVRYAADPRYLRVYDKPIFAVYRPLLIPDTHAFCQLCRKTFREAGFEDVHLVFVESMETVGKEIIPKDIGFDACIEFPPQGIGVEMEPPPSALTEDFAGTVYDYEATVENCVSRRSIAGKRYPTVFPGWDNTPRQPTRGDSFVRCTPEAFQVYLEEKLEEMSAMFVGDERLLFINAWNEWAEGAHLEPDQAFGHRWLESVRNALQSKSLL
jgi:GT2 family glycosyltransferase